MAEKLEVTVGWFDTKDPVERSIAECYIAPEFLLGIIQGIYEVDPVQFPSDVQVRHGAWDERSKSFKLLLESAEYWKTAEGNIPVIISLRLRHKG